MDPKLNNRSLTDSDLATSSIRKPPRKANIAPMKIRYDETVKRSKEGRYSICIRFFGVEDSILLYKEQP
jgi:hypothetical protein